MDLNNVLKGISMSSSALYTSFTSSSFIDPNTMEVDATWMNKHFVNVLDYKIGQAI